MGKAGASNGPRRFLARPGRCLRRDQKGVSEVLGNVLLVGITVLLTAGFATAIIAIPKPLAKLHADLSYDVVNPDGTWGNGDEEVRIHHRGGDSLEAKSTRIIVRLDQQLVELSGSQLQGAFSDGRLAIGETWRHSENIPFATPVAIGVVHHGQRGGQVLVGQQSLVAGGTAAAACLPDLAAPSVTSWVQTPADVSSLTVGAVTVRVQATDACSGVDQTVAPVLRHRINDGSNPAFSNAGSMALVATNTWEASIPSALWNTHTGKTLQYYAQGITDRAANALDSSVQSDLIQLISQLRYAGTSNAVQGTVTNFANLQSATDSGAEATLAEGATSSGATAQNRYGTTTSNSGATNAGNAAGIPDDQRAVIDGNNEYVRVGGFSPGTGTITKVEIVFEGRRTGVAVNDQAGLSYRVGGSAGATSATFLPGLADGQRVEEVTADRTWTWTNIQNLEVELQYLQAGSPDPMSVEIDSLWVRVTANSVTYSMEIQLGFSGVPSGATHTLQLQYRVSGDSFNVQLWDSGASAWNTRGSPLTSGSSAPWNYVLTSGEYAGGNPLVRILDVTPTGATQGQVFLDYARVATA